MKESFLPAGIWSATPTPLDEQGHVDTVSIPRMVEHHLALGVRGLLLAGTCGEGPWLSDQDRETLVRCTAEASQGRLALVYQVTDNSSARILENIARARQWGADAAIVASPYFFINSTAERLRKHYDDVFTHSELPIGYYDRGKHAGYPTDPEGLAHILDHPSLAFIKDSSCSAEKRELYRQAKDARPDLLLFNGDEFDCVAPALAGYDGCILGGGIFNARLAEAIQEAVQQGSASRAIEVQSLLNRIHGSVYGENVRCWMAGLKYLVWRLGVFSTTHSLLNYQQTEACRQDIDKLLTGEDGLDFPAWIGMGRPIAC